jgi:hypothetical protein
VLGVDISATSESLEHIAAMRAPPVRSAAAKSRIVSNRRSGASCELARLVYRHPFTLGTLSRSIYAQRVRTAVTRCHFPAHALTRSCLR